MIDVIQRAITEYLGDDFLVTRVECKLVESCREKIEITVLRNVLVHEIVINAVDDSTATTSNRNRSGRDDER